jgi:hypothetical protein
MKILPKLRGYINYSYQIAFEMEEKQVRKDTNLGVFVKTWKTKDGIKKQNE